MRVAIVLHAESPELLQQAGQINAFLKNISASCSNVDLWLFYQRHCPRKFPEINFPEIKIQLAQVRQQFLMEGYLQLLVQEMNKNGQQLVIFGGDQIGEEMATRLAYRLGGSSALQVESCNFNPNGFEITKPVYGHHLTARFLMTRPPYCLSISPQPSLPARRVDASPSNVTKIPMPFYQSKWVKKSSVQRYRRANGLSRSDFVIVLGQGVRNKETVQKIKKIAKHLGAELGASRQAVMNAWMEVDRLIGASGIAISPKLCIAAGVSGSPFFKIGIRNSEKIVAINTDGDAPIFQIADIGIVTEFEPVLEALERLVTTDKQAR